MPRLFYKAIVGLAFALAALAILAAEVWLWFWLLDKYPSWGAWVAFVLLGLIDVLIFEALWNAGVEHVRRA